MTRRGQDELMRLAEIGNRITEVLAKYNITLPAAPRDALTMAMDRMIQNRTQAGPITDDMIERGAEAICNEAEHVKPSGTVWGLYRRRARTALEAALRGKKE